jgi:hypothetical protein
MDAKTDWKVELREVRADSTRLCRDSAENA